MSEGEIWLWENTFYHLADCSIVIYRLWYTKIQFIPLKPLQARFSLNYRRTTVDVQKKVVLYWNLHWFLFPSIFSLEWNSIHSYTVYSINSMAQLDTAESMLYDSKRWVLHLFQNFEGRPNSVKRPLVFLEATWLLSFPAVLTFPPWAFLMASSRGCCFLVSSPAERSRFSSQMQFYNGLERLFLLAVDSLSKPLFSAL